MDYRNGLVVTETSRIASDATVIGDVILGEDCTVLFHATLRGDVGGKVIVGDRTNIQEGACLHVPLNGDVVVGSDVTVGHGALVHGCTVGDGTLIGMGAIVLDGAKVGKSCLIGAGAVVTGGADIPDKMLVLGSPARAVRPLTDDEVEGLSHNVNEYISIGKELQEQGFLLSGTEYAARLCSGVDK